MVTSTADNMDNARAVIVLHALYVTRGELIKAYQRKRSWSAAERAMAIAKVMEERSALSHAIVNLKEAK